MATAKNKSNNFNSTYIYHGMRVKKGKRTGTIVNILRSSFYGTDIRVSWDDKPNDPIWLSMTEIKPAA